LQLATASMTEDSVIVSVGSPIFTSSYRRIECVPEVKRQGREADHSPSASTKVKNTWIYTSTPSYAFMAYTA
jgi:hypothetical protein